MTMKIKPGFILRSLAGQELVVTIGEASRTFQGMMKLNPTGAFLWRELEQGRTRKELETALIHQYKISESQAEEGVDVFLNSIEKSGCILED